MGKGFLIGILFGAVFAAITLSAVSLMAPPVGSEIVIVSAARPDTENGPDTEKASAQGLAESTPQVSDDGDTAAVPGPGGAADSASAAQPPQDVPDVAMIEIPAGSDFARPKADGAMIVPGSEPPPPVSRAPKVPVPQDERSPQLADIAPAAAPTGQAEAPASMTAPKEAALQAATTGLAPSAPLPPAGLAQAPVLAESAADDHGAPGVDTSPPARTTAAGEAMAVPSAPKVGAAALADMSAADAGNVAAGVSPPDPATQTAAPAAPVATSDSQPPEAPILTDASAAPAKPAVPASDPAVLAPVESAGGPAATTPEPVTAPEPETRIKQAQATLPEVLPIVPGAAPATEIGDAAAPQPGFSETVPGVKINRLPSIGAAEADAPVTEEGGPPAAESAAPESDDREDLPAVMRYALEPGPAPGKPIFAVVILDVGQAGGGLAPDALAALGLPITVAVSPTDPDAASRAAQYRDAGFEVAILAPNLPQGANAADMEVSYQGYVSILPETVALIGQPDAEFQSNSRAAEHLAALLAADGRGLVSYARGLDPAGRAADKEGIPHAAIYRVLDAEHESPTTIGRYLDRAAFEADQTGQVLVVGHSYPETVAALKDWAAAGAKGTAIGPVTAAMLSGRPLN